MLDQKLCMRDDHLAFLPAHAGTVHRLVEEIR